MSKITFLVWFLCLPLFANQQIDNYDIKSYSPIKKGLKNLFFEVRSNNLKEIVESTTGVSLKDEVFFKVFWKFPSKVIVEMEGLPVGYKNIENNFKNIALEALDYIIPRSPKEILKAFTFKKVKSKEAAFVLRGVTEKSNISVSEIFLFFNKKEILNKMITISPHSKNETTFNFKTSKKSDNKLLIDSLVTVVTSGKSKLQIEKRFNYISVMGYLFPDRITTSIQPAVNEKPVVNSSEIRISNLKVNESFINKKLIKKINK